MRSDLQSFWCKLKSSTAMSLRHRLRLRILRKEDRISDLPDSLLEHILSFVPTKDAIATSILSKRWKPIWGSQLVFYLDGTSLQDTFAFRQFFNSFITMRDNTIPILSLHLKSRHHLHYNHDFVYAAITRVVETLIIDLLHPTALPSIVLSTKTLSVLKLKRVTLNYNPYVDLPSLKVLHLESITFTRVAYLHKILSGTPILHELESADLRVEIPTMMPPLGIAISNLVRASISGISFIGLEWLRNVEHLHMHVVVCINISNYSKFISLIVPYQHLCNSMQNRMPPNIRGVFHNLTHLELMFNFHSDDAFAVFKWRWLRKMLQNTPNLQTLIIHELYKVLPLCLDEELQRFYVKGWKDPKIVPECLLSHLTTCSLTNYSLIHSELQFAKYIMQNSRLLNTITIQSAEFLDTNTKLQMLIELSSCPRISPTSKLFFI